MIQKKGQTPHYRPVPRRFRRQRLLIIGCGDVGQRVVRQLHHGWQVVGVARSDETLQRIRTAGALAMQADDAHRLARWATHILHAAPPASRDGEVTDRLTRRWLQALARARGQRARTTSRPGRAHRLGARSTAALLAVPAPATQARSRSQHAPAPRLVYLSTTGVYGDRGGAFTRETDTLQPLTDRARRRVDAERQVRFGIHRPDGSNAGSPRADSPHADSTRSDSAHRDGARVSGARHRRLQPPPLPAIVLRVPGIYAADRLPVERLRQQVPALVPADDVITNHIHADDLARIARTALLRGPRQRVINAVDDSQMTLGDYLDQVADRLGLPRPPRHSRAELTQTLSEVRMSFMRESRRLDTRRLKRELRVRLQWPTVAEFLARAPI
ncbi:NAD-binding protein [Lautropia mirabilis]|uniref:NAD-binding protein n=1 Tax=Lautropia mirabilis TaxID=47671 RepID=UPI002349ECB2|nr:NAD-binding protein [Lautropia mirabilis]MDC6092569.1 NAD-binding protein [Lautropia mirabilis]